MAPAFFAYRAGRRGRNSHNAAVQDAERKTKHISENDRNFRTILAKCEGILSQHLKVILIIATAYSNKSLRTLCLLQRGGCLAGLSSLQPAPAKPGI